MSDTGRATDIFARYPNVQGNARGMAMLCSLLHKKGLYADALALGAAAIAEAPADMEVRDLVRMTLSADVPGFHAPMLQDEARNQIYRRAIERAVRPGMTVLEIGTGAGLLALIAARAGAQVITCESNPMLAAVAVEIAARNGLSDRIRVIAKKSDALQIGEDLDEPADMLMHEIFGDTLFGEGVVPALSDACGRLVKPGAPIVPPRAELRCALVELEKPPVSAPLGMVEGFDLSPFNLLRRPFWRSNAARQRGAQLRSEPQSALHVDFTLPAPFGEQRETIAFQSTGGRIDAVAQWMRIDFGNGEVLENSPFETAHSHWRAPLFDLVTPLETQPGDTLNIAFNRMGARLAVNLSM